MGKIAKRIFIYAFVSIFSLFLGIGVVFPQPKPKIEKGPEIKLGEIRFYSREMGFPPSQVKMLEIQIEVFNRSTRSPAPPNSIKVVVTPKEIKFTEGTPVTEFALNPQEVTLDLPLSPYTGRVLIIGYSLLETKPESITFEIQINPPDGEKKMVKWEGN
jgi:uncharacterized protein YneF (UPF0154 family)